MLTLGCGGGASEPPGPAPQQGTPEATFTPSATLDLGAVPADAFARRAVRIENTGDGPLTVLAAEVTGPRRDAWAVRAEPALGEAIAPSEVGRIEVEYQPCPALRRGPDPGDVCACPDRVDAGILQITTDADPRPKLISLSASAVAPGPRIEVDPPVELAFGTSTTAVVTIRNSGCSALSVARVDLTGAGGGPSGARRDFSLVGCEGWPCEVEASVCEDGCEASELPLRLEYDNRDPAADELAELRIESDDPVQPERILLVSASGTPGCLPPIPRIRTSTPACVDQPVRLDASETEAGAPGVALTGLSWAFAFAQPPVPELEVEADGRVARFVPERTGLYLVKLTATSSCSRPGELVEQLLVAPAGCQ